MSTVLTPEDIARVKGLGCLRDKRFSDVFNVRVITRNGKITTKEQRAIADAADRFGSGEVAMTTRQTVEIQGVKYENIDPLIAFLADFGLTTGGTGPKVRPVVSCKGTTCVFGLVDTFALSLAIHERFYIGYHDVLLPHKFKIAVGGCPNNCVKPDLNDIGIIGQRIVTPDLSKCHVCKKCVVAEKCPMKAIAFRDGTLHKSEVICNDCGRCLSTCPFGAFENAQVGYRIYLGGRWGKKGAKGQPLSYVFTSEEEVLDTVERAILFFRDNGVKGERFADTIARIGFENVERELLLPLC